ncbi:MAG: hypothetical protein QOE64_2620 [Frankiales bacterium]|nr:hypothetical protein [Frankiales bacterium]
MRLLVIGGTSFVGRHVVAQALDRGWEVTTFNRGVTGTPDPRVEARHGDRYADDGYASLGADTWDAVVDVSGQQPRAVQRGAQALAGRVDRYVFVSSISVYTDSETVSVDESSPVFDGAPDATDLDYAGSKAGAERAVLESFPDAVLVRAGLIFGPYENIARIAYWLRRCAEGGAVLAPGRPERPLQYVDARDLAAWMLDAAVDSGVRGAYNVTGPTGHATMGELLEACVTVSGGDAQLTWVDDERLLAAGGEPWSEFPAWVPEAWRLYDVHVDRAMASGLQTRPALDTVQGTWDAGLVPPRPGIGMTRERESELLAKIGG